MKLPRPAFFFVPGVFLMALGLGNFIVGTLKLTQYQEVTQELKAIHPSEAMFHLSPLRRLQLVNDSEYRLFQRKQYADSRKDFYRLIKFGGKIFMAVAVPFLLIGLLRLILWRDVQDLRPKD